MLLTKEAQTTYFKHYRRRMQTTFRNRAGQPSFRRELQAQATHLRRVILHKEAFVPFQAQVGGPQPVREKDAT